MFGARGDVLPTVRTGDIETHYEERGSGPPLVLLHASVLDHRAWRHQVPALAEGHRVIAYDLRGHGGTADSSPRGYSVDTLAEDLARLVDALGLERPIVCGWSLGGMVALTYASRRPDALAALVVAGTPTPAILSFAERMQRVVMPRVILGPARLVGYARMKRALLWIQARVHGEEAMGTFTAGDLPDMATRDFAKSVRAFATFHRTSVDLASIRVPTLVLHGAKEPPFVARHAARIRALVPRSSVVEIPDAGHALNLDQPERFNEAVLAFLAARAGPAPADARRRAA